MAINRLGELLVRNKLIDEKQLAKALEEQKATGGRLGASLTKLGFLKEEDLAAFLATISPSVADAVEVPVIASGGAGRPAHLAEALAAGMSGLKGHRSVGGCRASVYNAMPREGAQTLAEFMGEFARKHG